MAFCFSDTLFTITAIKDESKSHMLRYVWDMYFTFIYFFFVCFYSYKNRFSEKHYELRKKKLIKIGKYTFTRFVYKHFLFRFVMPQLH